MLWFIPRLEYDNLFNFTGNIFRQDLADILKGYAVFPFRLLIGLFPWCFMVWAPFCSALQALERNPLFNRYLTRIFVVLFVLIWLNPASLSRDILYLMPLLATLIGLKYWIVVRRYGYRFLSFFTVLSAIVMVLTLLSALLYLLPENFLQYIPGTGDRFVKLQKMPGMAIALCSIVLSFCISLYAFRYCRKKERVWLAYGMIFTSIMLLFFAVVIPAKAVTGEKKELAAGFKSAMLQQEKVSPDTTILYKDARITGLF